MKKMLLFASLLFAGSLFAQSFTPANEPAIGDAANMFVCDSTAPNYANTQGVGVTWDYTGTKKIAGEMKGISISSAASTPNGASFTSSNKAIEVQGFLTTYWATTAAERNSMGFVYNEPTLGEVKAVFSDPAKLMTYDFNQGDMLFDTYAGTLSFSLAGFPLTPAATGKTFSRVDGKGTLKLNAATTLTDVLRLSVIDTLNSTVNTPLGNFQVVFIRTQYEYYHFATSKLPVFTHASAVMTNDGTVVGEFTVVLNMFEPDEVLAVNDNTISNFSVYPNPVKSNLTIKGDFTQADAQIINQAGQVVKTISAVTPGTSISMSDLENGLYFLNLNINGQNNVQKIIKE